MVSGVQVNLAYAHSRQQGCSPPVGVLRGPTLGRGCREPAHSDLIYLWFRDSFPRRALQAFSFPSHAEVADFIRQTKDLR